MQKSGQFGGETGATGVAGPEATYSRPGLIGKRGGFRAVPLRSTVRSMGFNKRKMEDQRAVTRRRRKPRPGATDAQVLEDAERLIAAWTERQAKRMPMLFSPTIGAAIAVGH